MNVYVRRRLAALVLPVLVAATSACDIAMADHKEQETAEWRKTYELAPGGRVEIGNINGKIEVRPGQGNTVEVVAEKISKAASREAAREALNRIEITENISAALVKIDTKIQRGNNGLFSGGNLQVQYTVRVPVGVQLHISTVNGGLDVSGIEGRVHAEATNGGIRARDLIGPIEASTTNGGVDVSMLKLSDSIKLETVNGGIKLSLPADAKASVLAQVVNGGIDVDGVTIDAQTMSKRKLEGKMNGGGPNIDLQGVNGGIKISAR
jgi:hypothetical protein